MNDLQKTFAAVQSAMDWMPMANCRNMDVDMFFPTLGNNVPPFVKEVCVECLVIEECAWYANETKSEHGVMGGMTPEQRRKWRRKNNVTLGQSRVEWENRNQGYLHQPVGQWKKS